MDCSSLSSQIYTKTNDINQVNNDGFTALHIAAYNGHKEIVQLLIEELKKQNKDINPAKNDGWTVLHSAAEMGRKEIVQL